jgi:SAM-dependent methyltransferase
MARPEHRYHRADNAVTAERPLAVDFKVLSFFSPGQDVLVIGTATGYMGRALRARGVRSLCGLENDAGAAAEAKSVYDHFVVGDVQRPEIRAQIKGTFDLILIVAVVYALENPVPVLESLRSLLKPGGRLIVTFPNVAHWSMRRDLLLGRFDYTRYGLRDDTTARFYTRRSAEALLRTAGWTIERMSIDPDAGCPVVHPIVRRWPKIGFPLLRWFYGWWPELWAFQFLFVARPA